MAYERSRGQDAAQNRRLRPSTAFFLGWGQIWCDNETPEVERLAGADRPPRHRPVIASTAPSPTCRNSRKLSAAKPVCPWSAGPPVGLVNASLFTVEHALPRDAGTAAGVPGRSSLVIEGASSCSSASRLIQMVVISHHPGHASVTTSNNDANIRHSPTATNLPANRANAP